MTCTHEKPLAVKALAGGDTHRLVRLQIQEAQMAGVLS